MPFWKRTVILQMITHEIRLSMTPEIRKRPLVINVSQNDDSFQIVASLYSERGELTIESGTTADLRGTKPGGVAYTKSGRLNDNRVTIIGDSELTNAAGTGVFEICLTHDGKELYSENFHVEIETQAAL